MLSSAGSATVPPVSDPYCSAALQLADSAWKVHTPRLTTMATAAVFHLQLEFAQPAVLTDLQLLALQQCAQIVYQIFSACAMPTCCPMAQASAGCHFSAARCS